MEKRLEKSAQGTTILLLDPKPQSQGNTAEMLQGMKVSLQIAANQERAGIILKEHRCALIIVNIRGKDQTPIIQAKWLCDHHKGTVPPLLFIAPDKKTQTHLYQQFSEPVIADVICKPVDEIQLRRRVTLFLHFHSQHHIINAANAKNTQLQAKIKKKTQELKRLSSYDSLTGLPNRQEFEKMLATAISHAKRHDRMFALLFLDIDKFKSVNDSRGHHVGNLLLQEVSQRLKSCVRQDDFIMRISSDEFAIILTEIKKAHDAGVVALKLKNIVSSPYHLNGESVSISCSIGIACYPTALQNPSIEINESEMAMIKCADIALCRAQNAGHNHYRYFTRELNDAHMHRLNVENALCLALEHEQLFLVYQPQYNLATQSIIGMEVLMRWKHPQLGYVSPVDFIPIAEETGLIVSIGEWAIKTAMKQFSEWRKQLTEEITLAVNISPRQLIQGDLVNLISEMLEEYKLPAHLLELELTETALLADSDDSIAVLRQLHAQGLKISMDDFGTGYSSLSHLKHMPISAVKIDKEFVQDIESENHDAPLVTTVISLAESLGITVVAEGIETDQQLQFLINQGCHHGQGFLLSKPLTKKEMATQLGLRDTNETSALKANSTVNTIDMDNVLIISVVGNFTVLIKEAFMQSFENIDLEQNNYEKFVVNMQDVRYIDSNGLGTLLVLKDYADQNDIQVVLNNLNGYVKRVLEGHHFQNFFTLS